jgi:nitroimidazol reductase NimA-like FMN-containing flavoprotein (pyridoxamine 5'-phosphate oxidase superfamily)
MIAIMQKSKNVLRRPKATRPHMPNYGINGTRKGMLPWKWAEQILKDTQNYFLATVRSDRRPHVMPIWGVWIGGLFYFSTGKTSVKARNLAKNPHCVLCPGNADESVIVEGIARPASDDKDLKKYAKAYLEKYKWDVSKMDSPVFALEPRIVFGQIEKTYTQTATRWTFE